MGLVLGLLSATAGPAAGAGSVAAREKVSIVTADVASAGERDRLLARDLDVMLVEGGTAEVMLHGAKDAARLRRAGFDARVVAADVAADNRRARQAERARAQRLETSPALASPLPTGRVSYRTMDETNAELRELALQYPDRVTLFELPHRTLLGQRVVGVHVSRDGTTDSGRPVFLVTGVNHAREWPTVEFTMEFVWDVLLNDGSDLRITALLDRADLIAVPMVGPDAYDISRRLVYEQKRKNCRMEAREIPTRAECEAPVNEFLGVDLNRNYGALWGGRGSNSENPTSMYHQGQGPFSEPETQNMRELMGSHQITVAFNNHVPDRRLLRLPSAVNEPTLPDAEPYDALAATIADVFWPTTPRLRPAYSPASGTAEQSWYYAAGTFAYTPEAAPGFTGQDRYHPPYEYVIDQYFGTANAPGCIPGSTCYEGSSQREATLRAYEAAGNPELHSVISGTAKPGRTRLTIEKDVSLHTSPVPSPPEDMIHMTLRSTITVPKSGSFTWHVNPSLQANQLASGYLQESWTPSCRRGPSAKEVQVTIGRGEVARVDMRGCPRIPDSSGRAQRPVR